MSVHDMTEQAYRNGYAKGYQDAKKEERHGRWLYNRIVSPDFRICNQCGRPYRISKSESEYNLCPNCGAIMDLPNITEQTENALRKLGEHREEVDFDYNAED